MTARVRPTTVRHPVTAAPSSAAAAAVASPTRSADLPTQIHVERSRAVALACCDRIGLSEGEFTDLEQELRALVGAMITPLDVFWIAANRCVLDAGAQGDWARVVAIYDEMTDVLRSEGRRTDALEHQRTLAARHLPDTGPGWPMRSRVS